MQLRGPARQACGLRWRARAAAGRLVGRAPARGCKRLPSGPAAVMPMAQPLAGRTIVPLRL